MNNALWKCTEPETTSVLRLDKKCCMEATALKDRKIEANVWGIASAIDIYNCDPDKIRDAEVIRRFVVKLCELIEMKRFGDTLVVHFGEDERVAGKFEGFTPAACIFSISRLYFAFVDGCRAARSMAERSRPG